MERHDTTAEDFRESLTAQRIHGQDEVRRQALQREFCFDLLPDDDAIHAARDLAPFQACGVAARLLVSSAIHSC